MTKTVFKSIKNDTNLLQISTSVFLFGSHRLLSVLFIWRWQICLLIFTSIHIHHPPYSLQILFKETFSSLKSKILLLKENYAGLSGREFICIVNGIHEELLMGKHRSIKKYKFDLRVTFTSKSQRTTEL